MSAAWTDDEVRAALLLPKPVGAKAAEWEREAGRMFAQADVTKPERELLRYIADEADVVATTPHPDPMLFHSQVVWLLVAMPAHLLEALHAFEADLADYSHDYGDLDEREADVDHEPDVDREPDQDDWNHVEARAPEIVPARQVRRSRPRLPVIPAAE